MKTLLLTLTMLMVGCNLVALEAEDPQDQFYTNYNDITGNWYYTESSKARIEITSYTVKSIDSYTQTGSFESIEMPYTCHYELSNDTLYIMSEGKKLLPFVNK